MKDKKVWPCIVFGIYMLLLFWLILFKLADSAEKIPHMRALNLVPFHYDELSNTRFHLTEVLYNIAVFIPAGFFFTAFGKKKLRSGLLCSLALSLFFETAQWIFALGATDITDVMTNFSGGAVGTVLYFVSGKLFKGKQLKAACIIGTVLEALFAVLMIVLIAANS